MNRFSVIVAAALLVAGCCSEHRVTTDVTDFYAHRGGRQENDENTMQAFRQCVSIGVNRFETDVRMTRDGKLVISHDANLKRRTGYDGVIEEMTGREVTSKKTFLGNSIPSAEEVVRYFARKKASYVEFEMKTTDRELYPDDRIPQYCDALYSLVKRYEPAEGVRWVFTSFDTRPLQYLRAKDPDILIGYLTSDPVCGETIAAALSVGADQLECGFKNTTKEAVDSAHAAGLYICLWPGTSYKDYIIQKDLGADGMCTDLPNVISLEIEKDK